MISPYLSPQKVVHSPSFSLLSSLHQRLLLHSDDPLIIRKTYSSSHPLSSSQSLNFIDTDFDALSKLVKSSFEEHPGAFLEGVINKGFGVSSPHPYYSDFYNLDSCRGDHLLRGYSYDLSLDISAQVISFSIHNPHASSPPSISSSTSLSYAELYIVLEKGGEEFGGRIRDNLFPQPPAASLPDRRCREYGLIHEQGKLVAIL